MLCFLLSACSTPQWVRDINPLKPPPSIEVSSPRQGATIVRGDQIPVIVDFNSPLRVEKIEVTIWNLDTGEHEIFEFMNVADPHKFHFEQIIEVPVTLSPGMNCHLEVKAYPPEADTQTSTVSFGYLVPIKVQ